MDISKDLHWIGHASFYIDAGGKKVFIDPFDIRMRIEGKADLILITQLATIQTTRPSFP